MKVVQVRRVDRVYLMEEGASPSMESGSIVFVLRERVIMNIKKKKKSNFLIEQRYSITFLDEKKKKEDSDCFRELGDPIWTNFRNGTPSS